MSLTVLEFRSRFTMEEKVMMDLASLDNPSASMEQRLQSAGLRVYLADLAAVKDEVDETDPRTIAGVQALEAAGLIGPGRAAQILAPSEMANANSEVFVIPENTPVPGTSLVVVTTGSYTAHELIDCCMPSDETRTSVARYSAIYIATGEN